LEISSLAVWLIELMGVMIVVAAFAYALTDLLMVVNA
jgi:hypothetical protein